MARFCTQCGTRNESHARFCENCGNQIQPAATAATTAAAATTITTATATPDPVAAPSSGRRGLFIGSAIAAVLAVCGGGLAWWLAPESASSASFARAINTHFENNAGARDKILCISNLPYDRNPIRVDEFNQSTRQYMDTLAQAGVYDAPQQASSGGYFPRTQYVYALSEEGAKWVRKNRLCLGTGLQVKKVSGFEHVEEIQGKPFALGKAQLEITGEAPWLAKAPDREALLRELDRQSIPVSLPLARVEGKWTVSAMNPADMFTRRAAASDRTDRNANANTGGGFFDKLKALFSFGASHPLVGKWQDESGVVTLEFTHDAFVQNGLLVKAKFETRADMVTVTPETGLGFGLVLKMQDHDTALLDMGLASVTLRRVQ